MISFPFPLKMKPMDAPPAEATLVKPVQPVPAVRPGESAGEAKATAGEERAPVPASLHAN